MLPIKLADGSQFLLGAPGGARRVPAFSPGGGGGGGGGSRPTTTANSIAVGNVAFPWSGPALVCGHYLDGQAFVVRGATDVPFTDPSPAVSSLSGRVINGCVKNLERQVAGSTALHAFDSVLGSSYSASFQEAFPSNGAVGDCYVKVISQADYGGNVRDGVIQEYASIHVVDEVPPLNAFSPPVTWPASQKANRPTREADVAAIVAALPSYSTSGFGALPTYDEIYDRVRRWSPVVGFIGSAAVPTGHESHHPYGFGWRNGDANNYGDEICTGMDAVACALISDCLTTAQKETIATLLISMGIQWWEGVVGANDTLSADGGHWNYHYFATIFSLYATGQTAQIANWYTRMPGNAEQAFYLDAQAITDITTSHADASKPQSSFRRTLSAVSGNNLNFSASDRFRTVGLEVVRVSDGATANVLAQDKNIFQVTIDAQPSPAYQAGDQIWFRAPWTHNVGDAEWCVRGGPDGAQGLWNLYTPAQLSDYRENNHGGGQLVALHALGLVHSDFMAAYDYAKRSHLPNVPNAASDYMSQIDGRLWIEPTGDKYFCGEFWAAHGATIDAVTQTVG